MAKTWRDAAALGVLAAVVLAWCTPGLLHGPFFGSFDLVLFFGLGHGIYPTVHNALSGDTARQGAVWSVLNWQAVHAGHLPLWDPRVVLGLPEAANLQSAPASLPSLVSYLLPLRFAYSAIVVSKLLIGGIGCYLAARVLGTSRPAALLAGVVGELAGPMAAWAGWPQTGVAEWTGWLVAAVVLVLDRASWRRIVALAVVVALACAGGFPELVVVLAIGLGVFTLVAATRSSWRRSLPAVLGATVLGALLAAPTWLPGIPVLERSVIVGRVAPSLPAGELWLFLDPTYWGLPTSSSAWFGPSTSNYYESAAFVGPVVLALAIVGLLARWRDRRVLALVIGAAVLLALGSDLAAVVHAERGVPVIGSVAFGRGLLVVCDLLGLLAAVGLDAALRSRVRVVAGALVVTAVPVALVLAATLTSSLPAAERSSRLDGAWWAVAGLAAVLLVVLVRVLLTRRAALGRQVLGRHLLPLASGAVVVVEAASLVLTSTGVPTWSAQFLPENAAMSALVLAAGGGLVGLGGEHPATRTVDLGIMADLNADYGVRELQGYDGVMPKALEQEWAATSPAPDLARAEVAGDVTSFIPEITSEAQARTLGVSLLLDPLRPPLRLVSGASGKVTAAMRAAGVDAPAAAVGVVDALEWLAEQPSLIKQFPLVRPGSLADYLETAAHSALADPPPSDDVAAGAAAVVPLLPGHPALLEALRACFTNSLPAGLVEVRRLGSEILYRFAGATGAGLVDPDAGRVVGALRYLDNSSADVVVRARRPAWVRLGIDAEPGWRASSDGRSLPVSTTGDGALLSVRVPAGEHRIVLTYWPEGLTLALWLSLAAAIVSIAGLVAGPTVGRRRAREARQTARSGAGETLGFRRDAG